MEALPDLTLHRPATLAELRALLDANPTARLLGGGTDLLVNLRRGIDTPDVMVETTRVADLHGLSVADDGALTVGAAVTLERLAADPAVRAGWPALAQAAEAVAGPTHRAVATVGGNLCLDTRCVYYNQSEWWRSANDYCLKKAGEMCHVAPKSKICFACFSGDVAPAALVAGATVRLSAPTGEREIPLTDLYREDGAAHLTLAPGEIVVSLTVPSVAGWETAYRKVRVRGSVDFPLAGIAMAMQRTDGQVTALRLATTGTNARPLLVDGIDALLPAPADEAFLDTLERLMGKQMQPMSSTLTPQTYRRRVALNVMRGMVGG